MKNEMSDWLLVLGLKIHDCFYETPEVKEAIRRLPPKVVDERNFRIFRALQLSMTKTYLPQEQWTKYEDVRHWTYQLANYLITLLHIRLRLRVRVGNW